MKSDALTPKYIHYCHVTSIRWIFRCNFSLGSIFRAFLLRWRACGISFFSTSCLASDINIAYWTWSSSERLCRACWDGEAREEGPVDWGEGSEDFWEVSDDTAGESLSEDKTPLLEELEEDFSILEDLTDVLSADSRK